MMRKFYLLMMLLAVSTIATAQDKMTLDAQLLANRQQTLEKQGRRSASTDENRLTLVVKVADEIAVETYNAIRNAGGRIEGVLGQQAVINIPVSGVQRIATLKGIERIDVTHTGKPLTDISVKETKVSDIINKPAGAATSLTGKGVMVCIIDCGFNFTHAAFTDGNGNSRIKCVYMMEQKSGNDGHKQLTYNDPKAGEVTAPGYYYDTPEGIKSLSENDGYRDLHGTHVAGIAVGTKSALGFTGMAPEADIMMIPISSSFDLLHFDVYQSCLEKALMFAVNYAKQKKIDLIINMSIGTHEGPHNGTGTIPEMMGEVAKTAIPVMSSGNEGNGNSHIYKKFTATDNTLKALLPMTSSTYDDVTSYSTSATAAGYSRQAAVTGQTVKVKLVIFHQDRVDWSHEIAYTIGDPTTTWAVSGDPTEKDIPYDKQLTPFTEGKVSIVAGTVDGRLNIKAFVGAGIMSNPEEGAKPDPYTLIVEGYDGLEMDFWSNTFANANGYIHADNDITANDWVSTPNVISVGAYCTNTFARKYCTNDQDKSKEFTLGDIAFFSSCGEFLNGVKSPTVCAPGVNIVSAINPMGLDPFEVVSQKESMKWNGSPYDSENGTSMACPHVAGIIALWLQAKPGLTFEQVKDVLKNACDNDEFTAKTPIRWGYGKINAQKGLNYILNLTPSGIEEVKSAVPQTQDSKIYNLQGRQVTNPTHGIYIVGGRKVVMK